MKRALEALNQTEQPSALREILKRIGEITAKDIFAAAPNDPLAEKLVEDTAFYLAVGAMNMMHTIDPDMIVYGGGMMGAGESFLNRIRKHVKELAFPVPAAKTEIRYALLGSDAGFIGAAGCGRQLVRSIDASV